ncbi:protein SOSEKI 2 [Corylus avellana]|uniref:protein SOSEKI 2 n=1 Tax=Corylus avellana TaxID=13451 RepID=UPI001E20415E|nr:protein SOSEKI 2 [Corylus avellana]
MDVRSRRARETSPDRVKVYMMQQQQQQQRVKPIKKVQVVYYLSRNGHLEHPHYMEVTHLPNQPLRLRDVMERLTVLRGKGMPSLYSWSCKRSYKSGYVWNDLAENDIIYPAEGAEFVLKGSELVEGCSERFQQIQISNMQEIQQIQEPNYHSKRKQLDQEFEEYEEGEEFEDGEKISYTSSTTPQSRCSRGVSTDEIEDNETRQPEIRKNPAELSLNESSPPSTISSTDSDKANQSNSNSKRVVEDGDPVGSQRGNNSKRFEAGNPVANESAPSRNSVLLQLIACGGSAAAKSKSAQSLRQPVAVKKSDSLHRGVLCKSAVMVGEEDMIRYMSENPRFGNLQAEEKEYFSGSIVESMSEDRVVAEPVLKRSNSFNEERSKRVGQLGEAMEEEKRERAAVKGKCLPRKKSFTSMKQAKK